MGAEFKYKNPLTIQLGTGVTGSVNGENFTSREIQGLVDENVTINIGQAVETTSNTTFNNVTSSNVLKAGNLFLGDGFISSSNSVVAHTGSVVVTGNTTIPSMTINGQLNAPDFEVSVTGSSVRRVTGIKAKQAFFAPAIEILPFNGPFPVTNIESKLNPFELPYLNKLMIAP